MKSILVPLVFPESAPGPLAAACSLGRRFGSHIEGYYAYPMRTVLVSDAMGAAASFPSDMSENWLALERQAHKAFDRHMREYGISVDDADAADRTVSAGWYEPERNRSIVIGEYGRLFDVIVVGRHERDPSMVMVVCEEVLFDSGRPLLLTPEQPPNQLGKRILIAWNGSTETASTIGLGVPLLESADSVRVLTVVGATVSGPTGEQVASHLRRRGISAEAETIDPGRRGAGEVILEDARAWNADLIFKGAYTHSRLRQMIFGGATRHILSEATLPVFVAR